MGILSAMNKSVGGINAQSFALENISGNIANAQTTAFKRTDTSFQDLVQSGASRVSMMASGNVKASARSTVGIQGNVEASETSTYMAVRGNGFFVVRQRAGEVDGATVFDSGMAYTRRGDFKLDKEGYLVNESGYYLAGLSIDPTTGNPRGDIPDTIKITNDPIRAEPTTLISYRLNLPQKPFTDYQRSHEDTAGSDIWTQDADRPNGPTATVDADGETEFLANTISGGAVTTYDSSGAPVNVQIRWAKTAVDTDGKATWKAYYIQDSTATGAEPKWVDVGTDFVFNKDGTLDTPVGGKISITDLTVDGNNLGEIDVEWGTGGITQYADTTGKSNVRQLTQDGLPAGNFTGVSIADGGRVVAKYSNGKTVDLYQIPLMEFSGESSLQPKDGGAYAETKESGPPSTNASGQIVGSSLESSNVDIGQEFTKLIVTQQAFSANSRVITTADQMMSDILNIIR